MRISDWSSDVCSSYLGMLPVCTGSDTGGSLRIPAAFCGVTGFRPSPGTVPSDKRGFGWAPISVQGPMGRSAADASLMMAAQAGFDSCDPFSTPVDGMSFRTPQPVDLGRLRVAYTEDLGFAPVDNDILAAFRSKVRSFKGLFREIGRASCRER